MAEQQRNVIDILTTDHREVEQMFVELESLHGATSDDDRQRRKDLVEQVTIELVRHSVAEEAEVYPVVAEGQRVRGGAVQARTRRSREDHEAVGGSAA